MIRIRMYMLQLTSKKTKSKTVFGPRRTKAGVHPLKRNRGPSSRSDLRNTSIGLALCD